MQDVIEDFRRTINESYDQLARLTEDASAAADFIGQVVAKRIDRPSHRFRLEQSSAICPSAD